MTGTTFPSAGDEFPHVEDVELRGHILDSLLLPKVLDEILTRGGSYELKDIQVGQRSVDPSYARIQVKAKTEAELEDILEQIHDHGATTVAADDCLTQSADIAGAFPEGFYSTTNHHTQVRLRGEWVDVDFIEMDCGIVVSSDQQQAVCTPMIDVKPGDAVVVGHKGIRVLASEIAETRKNLFEFMASPVSSEKPKGVTVREIAAAMKRCRQAGERILAVLGPALVHTGGVEPLCEMIRLGFLNVLFAGNALATHDMEQALFGTSLGISMDRGLPEDEGHEHHLRTINRIRRAGGIRQAVEQGILGSGIMYHCVKCQIPYILGGSIRDDGPLPEVITDTIQAQAAMRQEIRKGVGFCLMMATALHSIATGNMLPASVKVACVDINPATVTKLMDRGSIQTVGVVSDAEPFLRELAAELRII
jgi:lysine-ketoglutarate reductase/saccharopine dehydrogenase-like protein (TIGR00300 family)